VKKDLGAFIEKYIDDHTDDISALLLELIDETEEVTGLSRWSIGKVEGKLLQLLVKISGARNAIEIGTFTGYSALIIAEALPEDGRLITCETNPKHAEIALRYFRKSPQGSKIRLELKPAIETLRGIADNSVDFVFIDADKPSYGRYFDEAMRIYSLIMFFGETRFLNSPLQMRMPGQLRPLMKRSKMTTAPKK
jgi:caffeoyl-CoA O-methyltransferase